MMNYRYAYALIIGFVFMFFNTSFSESNYSTFLDVCPNPTNVALGKVATQSTTQQGRIASYAIDGITNYDNYSLTQWVTEQWWEVDLGDSYSIDQINVWNVKGNVQLNNYYVFISELPFPPGSSSTNLVNNPNVINYFESSEADFPTVINTSGITARYVRVQLPANSFLKIGEIEVIGCEGSVTCPPAGTPCDDGNPNTENDIEDGNCNCSGTPISGGGCTTVTNLSLNKPAQPAGQQGTTAALAVDGNTNGNPWPSPQSVFISNWLIHPYWEVDIESIYNIETINIWNRTDDGSQLTNYYVFVSDNPFTSTDINETLNQPGVSAFEQNVMAGFPTTIAIDRTGRYIRVQRDAKSTGGGLISIAEVEVMGCEMGGGGTPQTGEGVFAELRKKLNGDYTIPSDQELRFTYQEDYAIVDGENNSLRYKVKNWRNKTVLSGALPNLYRANWQTLPLPDPPTVVTVDIPSLLPEFFYILEVEDVSKDETYFLRFQYYFMQELQVAGGGQTN